LRIKIRGIIMRLSMILLAAGEAKRMNGMKIRYKFDGKRSMLEKILDETNDLNLRNSIELVKILVTNENHEAFVREKAENWHILINAAYRSGMSTSIVSGVEKAVELRSEALLLLLADMPYISREEITQVIEKFMNEECPELQSKLIIRPYYKDIPGFPVLFGLSHFNALAALKGDKGAKQVILANRDHLIKLPSENEGCIIDVDVSK